MTSEMAAGGGLCARLHHQGTEHRAQSTEHRASGRMVV